MGFKIAVCPSCNATITVPRLTELEAENERLLAALEHAEIAINAGSYGNALGFIREALKGEGE